MTTTYNMILHTRIFRYKMSCLIIIFLFFSPFTYSQTTAPKSDADIASMVKAYKSDPRGPYRDIMWFCKDGSYRIPKERCPEPSPQRARYKDEVIALGKSNGIYLGQILSTTDFKDFWDSEKGNSRIKQYQLEKYLRSVDDGWVLRKARYYRGAIQAEDEETWGVNFLKSTLSDEKLVQSQFFLIRQSAKDIPHRGDDNQTQLIRSLSLTLADQYPAFMNLRVKLHGRPEASDVQAVQKFYIANKSSLSTDQQKKFEQLIGTLNAYYAPLKPGTYQEYLKVLTDNLESTAAINELIDSYGNSDSFQRIDRLASVLAGIRNDMAQPLSPEQLLALLDASIISEKLLLQEISSISTLQISEGMSLANDMIKSLYGCGYLEKWEYNTLRKDIEINLQGSITLSQFNRLNERFRSSLEWGTGMVRATYASTVSLFAGFEPLAPGFIDDIIRSSPLLPLGNLLSTLEELYATEAGITNKVLDIPNQGHIRGLNAGYALGVLEVLDDPEHLELDPKKIYVFDRPPADLKPIAGIASVTEGNAVSHVQLLARNLGIPNAIVSRANLESFKKYAGEKVFYAVSNSGAVIMKKASDMNEMEKSLFSKQARPEEMIRIPIEQIRLAEKGLINLKDLRAKDSGELCGPKAANLGELKYHFPDNVVNGLVVPFGLFLDHMKQQIPGKELSYWDYLNNIFDEANKRSGNDSQENIDKYVLKELEELRNLIKKMPLKPSLKEELQARFKDVLGDELGKVPVFLRSDTNMEDLKDFTGAGLNLTVFNAVSEEKILQGIKDVWASPYTERSYKWRQKYLLNPENVYPSILIIPSVDVDYSGVLITKGISNGDNDAMTIAFSRGAGGAVDGQAAESYLLNKDGSRKMLSPAREPSRNSLPITGGTLKLRTTFENQILNESNFKNIRTIGDQIIKAYNDAGGTGPYDIELGFLDDKLWLFQVRPFVENKRAASSAYLLSISPKIKNSNVPLNTSLTL